MSELQIAEKLDLKEVADNLTLKNDTDASRRVLRQLITKWYEGIVDGAKKEEAEEEEIKSKFVMLLRDVELKLGSKKKEASADSIVKGHKGGR